MEHNGFVASHINFINNYTLCVAIDQSHNYYAIYNYVNSKATVQLYTMVQLHFNTHFNTHFNIHASMVTSHEQIRIRVRTFALSAFAYAYARYAAYGN